MWNTEYIKNIKICAMADLRTGNCTAEDVEWMQEKHAKEENYQLAEGLKQALEGYKKETDEKNNAKRKVRTVANGVFNH